MVSYQSLSLVLDEAVIETQVIGNQKSKTTQEWECPTENTLSTLRKIPQDTDELKTSDGLGGGNGRKEQYSKQRKQRIQRACRRGTIPLRKN